MTIIEKMMTNGKISYSFIPVDVSATLPSSERKKVGKFHNTTCPKPTQLTK